MTDGGADRNTDGKEGPERDIFAQIDPRGDGHVAVGETEYTFYGGDWFNVADALTPVDLFLCSLAA